MSKAKARLMSQAKARRRRRKNSGEGQFRALIVKTSAVGPSESAIHSARYQKKIAGAWVDVSPDKVAGLAARR